jgi:threonine dehydratase
MWEYAQELVDEAVAVPVSEAADAVRLLVNRGRIVAEGAGALSVAAAVAGAAGTGRVVCIVSGGNIDADVLSRILVS